jgi:hypothetical protein
MKKLYPFFVLLFFPSFLFAANRYWVATGVVSNWSSSINWSTTNGGAPGASVPGVNDVAFFTGNSVTNCQLTTNTNISGLRLNTGFTGQLLLNGNNLTIGANDLSIASGFILCGTGNITLNGTTAISGGDLNTGSGNASFTQSLTQTGGTFTGNTATITFTASLSITGGTFTSTSNTLILSNALTINSTGSFVHNNGTVEIRGNNNDDISLSGATPASLQLFKFIINKPNNTNLLGISGNDTLIINDSAIFINGGMDGGGVLTARKNLWVQSTFDNCSNPIRIEGTGTSRLISDKTLCTSNGSGLTINKNNSTDSVLIIRSTGSGTITEGQGNNAFNIISGVAAYPQNNKVQLSFNSITIQLAGTFVATQDSLFNAGAHNNSGGGKFKHNNGVYIFNGSNNRTYDVSALVPDTFYHVLINKPGGADNVDFASGDSMIILQNLTIADGQLNGTGTIGGIKLHGNLQSGTLMTATNLGLVFTGAANQTVNFTGTTSSNWNGDVRINKSSGTVTLLSVFRLDAGAAQDLTFVNGKMITTNTNLLIIGGTTVVTGANNNSFAEGPVRKDGNQTFVFPIGKGNIYAPLRISNFSGANASTQFRAEYFRSNPHPAYDKNSKDATITSISGCEYWLLDRLNTSATVKVGLSYDAARSCGFSSFISLKTCRWNGTRWVDHGNDNLGPAGFITSAANVTSFSPFTLGASIVVLPVELKSFTARASSGKVNLTWSTISEINSRKFEIQRSANGIHFSTIATIGAAGSSAQLITYNMVDEKPFDGKNYYRIKMVDRDDKFIYSDVMLVILEMINIRQLKIYPNPVTGNSTTVQSKLFANQTVTVQIINQGGQPVFTKKVTMNADGTAQIYPLHQLLPGFYFIKVTGKDNLFTEPLLIQSK